MVVIVVVRTGEHHRLAWLVELEADLVARTRSRGDWHASAVFSGRSSQTNDASCVLSSAGGIC
jgi:hypothetical protein